MHRSIGHENMRNAFTFETIATLSSDYKEGNTCIKNNKVHFIFEVEIVVTVGQKEI